ncbi:MAG TPA: chemotaxis protein CheX [Candidatus Tumulicola sp.]|nr:chemotaxis protein CheX [Candidatus Tumulicola sp.]
MTDSDLNLFVGIVVNYFQKIARQKPHLREPVIEFRPPSFLDYSGFIRLSGSNEGCIYITMPSAFLTEVLHRIGEKDVDDSLRRDLVGEMASTIASNAREQFGNQLHISVPETIQDGQQPSFAIPSTRFMLPIEWNDQLAYLGIALAS